ncbi:MAG: 7-carboxy-7-deazaguanine synthase QueE, partial [Bacteroidia bacterium]
GEPTIHNLNKLTQLLHAAGFIINIETSGSSPLSGELDWICLSPKKFKNPLPEAYQKAQELKIIVFNEHDFRWAEEEAAEVNPDCVLLLQPEWGRQEKMLPRIIEYVKQNPKWRVSLQTHKFMQIP